MVEGSGRDQKPHPTGGLSEFEVVIARDANQLVHGVALIDSERGVEIAPGRLKGDHAREGRCPLIPDRVAPAALTMVGLTGFPGSIDRVAGDGSLISRQRLGCREIVVGGYGHRFIQQPSTDRGEGDIESAVLIDLLGGIGIGAIRIAAIELTNDLLLRIEERRTGTAHLGHSAGPSHGAKIGVLALGDSDANAFVITLWMVNASQGFSGGRRIGIPSGIRDTVRNRAPQLHEAVVVAAASAFGREDAGTTDGPGNR